MLQEFNFTEGTFGQDLLAEDIGDLLDCNSVACSIICSSAVDRSVSGGTWTEEKCNSGVRHSPDDAVCALTKLFRYGVPVINDEILIEDLEVLAALKLCHYACAQSLARQGRGLVQDHERFLKMTGTRSSSMALQTFAQSCGYFGSWFKIKE